MELLNIPSLITIKGPDGSEQPTSLKEYLRTLISANGIATFLSHKVEMYGTADAGAIRVRIPYRLMTSHYNNFGGNKTQDMEMTNVVVPIEEERIVKTRVQKFDMVRFQNSGAYQAEILGSIAQTIMLQLNFEFYKAALESLKSNKQNTLKLDFTKIANSVEDLTAFKMNVYKYVQFINKAKKVFTRMNYSLETSDINTVLDSIGQANMVYSFTTGNAADKAIDIQVEGSKVVAKQLGGLNYIIDNGAIDNIHPTGVSVSLDDEYDFSNLTAMSIYAGAIALPYLIESVVSTIDPDTMRPVIASLFLFGKKVVLPQFVWGAVKDDTGYVVNTNGAKVSIMGNLTNPTSLKVVSTPVSLSLEDLGTITATSSNEAVATVSYANGVITITKVANGSCDIEVKSSIQKVLGDKKTITFVQE